MKSPIFRLQRKIRLLKARRLVEKGQSHDVAWNKEKLLEYWRETANQTGGQLHDNAPVGYAEATGERLEMVNYISEKITQLCAHDEPILELGTNAGLTFSYLHKNGYRNLTGIEINPVAISVMKEKFPDMYNDSKIINGGFEDTLPTMKENSFFLVYSTAVLMHVHPSSNFIFEHIARISKKYIITLELEDHIYNRIFPRKYKKIFENLGFKQIFFEKTGNKTPKYGNYHCRIFQKISA